MGKLNLSSLFIKKKYIIKRDKEKGEGRRDPIGGPLFKLNQLQPENTHTVCMQIKKECPNNVSSHISDTISYFLYYLLVILFHFNSNFIFLYNYPLFCILIF